MSESETPERYQPADPTNADETIAQLVSAGPEKARTIIPEAQAEALVYRDLLGHTRQQSEDALGVSKSTVDDRLRRGRDNVQAVAATARVLLGLGLLDHADLALEPTDDADDDGESVEEPEPGDETPTPWGRIMALDAVTDVTRSTDGTAVTVTLDHASDADRETVEAALADLGLGVYGTEEYGDSGREKVRARTPESDGDERPSESAESAPQADAGTEADQQGDADHDAESADADDLADDLADLDLPGNEEKVEQRREAVAACYRYLANERTASRKDFIDAVYPEHPAQYGSGASWWPTIKGALEALAERRGDFSAPENPRSGDKWTYDGETNE